MKKSQQYLYLVIILLLGLLLASFIKPFMEGFKEGASPCMKKYTYDDVKKACITEVGVPSGSTQDTVKCQFEDGKLKCGYKLP